MSAPGKAKLHPIKITEAAYKDVRSVVLESDALRVEVIPESGAKMASLFHKKTGVEHLYQRSGETFRVVAYADAFREGEAAGFDEMFPTISACYCDVQPWAGALMPDHGEVWSIPWRFEVKEAAVRLWVHGVRFPYILSKTISFETANTVLLQYCVENPTPFAFPAMWAAHPLFNASPGSRIILPESVRNIVNTVPGPALGAYGGRFDFPVARTPEGKEWDLSRLGANEGKYFFKYFCLDELKEGFALIHDPETRETTAMCWPVDQLPYLGMWVNEGAWEGQFNVAPEPCTAPFDRWDVARQWGKLPVVPAFGSLQWELRLTIDLADDPRRVSANGVIE